MVVKDILRVLYVPHKVFKDIIQNPKYWGPFILLLIFVLAQVGSSYVVASRSYIEQTMPVGDKGDVWTENAALWQAGPSVTIRNNTADYINSTLYYGSTSIEFAASNASNVWMELSSLDGSVNCGVDGFKNVSLRVKLVAPDVKPENVSIYLYSLSGSDFYYDLTQTFSSSDVNVWNNITLTIGVGSEGWVNNGADATWENIAGLKLNFAWPSSSNVDLRIDGLFFRGNFKDPFELYGSSYLATSALNAIAPFLFEWLLLTGLMYVIIKGLKGNVVWRPLMVAVGFALVTLVIQALILAVVYTSLPNLYYPLEVLAGTLGEFEVAYQVILDEMAFVTLVGVIIQAAIYAWTVALGTFITRAITGDKKIAEQLSMGKVASDATISRDVTEFGWMKSLLVSGASLFLTIIILGLLLGI
ncbi:MAG TPA: hypothetical protein VMW84_04220 [Acidobacteriota bacterium]|nr:hypothetical protein [Acidobacteriota bacterium]